MSQLPVRKSIASLMRSVWTSEVVLELHDRNGAGARFNELLNCIDGISDRVLTERLRQLEMLELVSRDVDGGPPVKVRYRLTPAGALFVPALRELNAAIESAT